MNTEYMMKVTSSPVLSTPSSFNNTPRQITSTMPPNRQRMMKETKAPRQRAPFSARSRAAVTLRS